MLEASSREPRLLNSTCFDPLPVNMNWQNVGESAKSLSESGVGRVYGRELGVEDRIVVGSQGRSRSGTPLERTRRIFLLPGVFRPLEEKNR